MVIYHLLYKSWEVIGVSYPSYLSCKKAIYRDYNWYTGPMYHCQVDDDHRSLPWHNHQKFQVPKIEVLSLKMLFWGWGFPYITRIHTAYIGEDSSILGT